MYAVIFEVEIAEGKQSQYLEIAAQEKGRDSILRIIELELQKLKEIIICKQAV